ncbi:hypothetical protein [Pseudoalteromonas sp. JSTW]|uniref:hypothetical protein n=1 Tax=Pseudoalteromonas sp. JSTW TaxID=2752475 RepID=UPI0015D55553|nr:hypothetical protein [Pseudoalteromonas sp. JSTW]QLJ07248.1 hypothetical protein GZH31_10610 [Pseudoalteromonas sp. JSTW]
MEEVKLLKINVKKSFFGVVFTTSFLAVAATNIPGVKKLKEIKEDTFKVHCVNGTKGVISREESNICAYSKNGAKNRCDDENNWNIEIAAKYICN